MNSFLEHVTFRRTRTRSEPDDDNGNKSKNLDSTTNSMPELSEDEEDIQLIAYKDEIKKLQSQLQSAHNEIELLSLQNSDLKQINNELMKKNDIFKNIASSPIKKKVKTPLKKTINSSMKTKQTQTTEYPTFKLCTQEDKTKITPQDIKQPKIQLLPMRHKICIVSSETSDRIYKMSEKTQLANYSRCHYRTPRCGLKHVLCNIHEKVRNFTFFDYCIIVIGEEDFRQTNNYMELVSYIRETLLPLSHTNFIISLPTFKYMENNANIMFNSRIDIFNNLIYMDAETHKYAYILDSNLNLPYSYDSYNQRSGSINNKALNIIVTDLESFILNLNALNTTYQDINCIQNLSTGKIITQNDISVINDTKHCDEDNFFRV